jgi:hypothetical protein
MPTSSNASSRPANTKIRATGTCSRGSTPRSPACTAAAKQLADETLAQNSLDWPQRARHTQALVTVNDEVDTVAAALQAEAHAPTVANHLVFEADARVVRAQARTILRTPALLPARNRAAYERMLNDFITVANLLQPGPGYGTTPQDYTAWYQALHASNITVY